MLCLWLSYIFVLKFFKPDLFLETSLSYFLQILSNNKNSGLVEMAARSCFKIQYCLFERLGGGGIWVVNCGRGYLGKDGEWQYGIFFLVKRYICDCLD